MEGRELLLLAPPQSLAPAAARAPAAECALTPTRTPSPLTRCRSIQRDVAVRGRDVGGVIEQYTRFVKPAFDQYVAPSRKHADVIIPWQRCDNRHVAGAPPRTLPVRIPRAVCAPHALPARSLPCIHAPRRVPPRLAARTTWWPSTSSQSISA